MRVIKNKTMKCLLPFAIILISGLTQAQAPLCDKLPYRLGHLVVLNSTDLRSNRRPVSKKELKELGKKQDKAQAECNAFVSKHPGEPVSSEFSYTVERFAAYYGRCESFCGTDKDWQQLIQKEADEAAAPPKR
jgi:hypothetical protein